jgi:queuine tRNA-ribosyltransferase
MWTLPVFARVSALLDTKDDCARATYSRSTAVRTALLLAGFFVGKGEGVESKEETTVAANRRSLILSPLDARWLRRAQVSAAAEPWTRPPFLRQPLKPETREALSRHPQFGDG